MIASAGAFFLPETKGRSLEDMDIIFGAITQEQRDADIARRMDTAAAKTQALENEEGAHNLDEKYDDRRTERV
jgi:hypothetical protein